MLTDLGRASTTLRLRAMFVAALLGAAPGCALIPTWDDVSSATTTVKDTISGKARIDRQRQAFAEARIMERRQDYAGAEKVYRELLAEVPNSRDCYHRLGVMASQQGKFDEAEGLFKQALDCGEPSADLWNDIGYCHYLQQRLPDAERAYHEALKLTPQHRASLNNLAMVVGEQGNLDEAFRLFREANSEGEAEANFAYLCAQCGDLQRAQRHYSRALSSDPELRSALEGLFQVTQRLQRLQDAAAPGGDPAANSPDGVQQAAYLADQPPPRRLIEVYTGGPRRPSSPASAPAASDAKADGGAKADAGPSASPTPAAPQAAMGPPQPQNPGLMPHGQVETPQPYSFASQAQPQYLQPSAQPGAAHALNSGTAQAGMPAPTVGGLAAPFGGGAAASR